MSGKITKIYTAKANCVFNDLQIRRGSKVNRKWERQATKRSRTGNKNIFWPPLAWPTFSSPKSVTTAAMKSVQFNISHYCWATTVSVISSIASTLTATFKRTVSTLRLQVARVNNVIRQTCSEKSASSNASPSCNKASVVTQYQAEVLCIWYAKRNQAM